MALCLLPAFRIGLNPDAAPLVDRAELAYLIDPPIRGTVTQNDILVQFRVGSIDVGVHSRAAVRHYRIDGDLTKRIDPLALSPRDFIEEWKTTGWKDVAHWSESRGRAAMRSVHAKEQYAEFVYPTMHCPTTPDLWQVGLDFDPHFNQPPSRETVYFLVRWRPPFRFSMVDVSSHPWPGCTVKDPKADEDRTLFPGGGGSN